MPTTRLRCSTKDYYDALLGIRYRFDLSGRWALLTRGDFSFGDSKGTWLVQGLFAYTVGKRQRNRIMFGYQYKEETASCSATNTKKRSSGTVI